MFYVHIQKKKVKCSWEEYFIINLYQMVVGDGEAKLSSFALIHQK